jgi:hypothetical protein
MAIKKEPGKGLIAKVRSKRVANANKPKMSAKLDGTYGNIPIEGRKVGYSKETTYKEKNALGKPVNKERKVVPTSDGGFAVRKTRTTTGKDGLGSKRKFTEKKYDASGKLIGKSRVKSTRDASDIRTKSKSVYREKSGSVLKKKNDEVTKATGRFSSTIDQAKREVARTPAKYDVAKVNKAIATNRAGKVKRVMKREMMKGRPF